MGWDPWIVFVHVAAAFLFVMGPGAPLWESDQNPYEPDVARVQGLLVMSSRSPRRVYGGLFAEKEPQGRAAMTRGGTRVGAVRFGAALLDPSSGVGRQEGFGRVDTHRP